MSDLPRNVALVYDRVAKWGGAEQVLLALHELFPRAPLYTAIHDQQKTSWSKIFPAVIPTFLQKFPLIVKHYEQFPWAMPVAFECLSFNQYDAVISITSAEAKSIITHPSTMHICYCLTPSRYLWSHNDQYVSHLPVWKRTFAQPLLKYLQAVDRVACHRPDEYISISETVRDRVKKYYNIESEIVYPPVDIDSFTTGKDGGYFLWIGRLVKYKNPAAVIELFNKIGLPLVVIGEGAEKDRLKKIAQSNITITGFIGRSEVLGYMKNASALISMHAEDFGINYIEAQAAGKPILGLNIGALTEIITSKKTGTLVDSTDQLEKIIQNFDSNQFSAKMCIQNAARFSKQRFLENFAKVYASAWTTYKNIYMS